MWSPFAGGVGGEGEVSSPAVSRSRASRASRSSLSFRSSRSKSSSSKDRLQHEVQHPELLVFDPDPHLSIVELVLLLLGVVRECHG